MNSLEKSGLISHLGNFSVLQRSLKDSWPALGVPSFEAATKLTTGVKDVVKVVLIVDGTG